MSASMSLKEWSVKPLSKSSKNKLDNYVKFMEKLDAWRTEMVGKTVNTSFPNMSRLQVKTTYVDLAKLPKGGHHVAIQITSGKTVINATARVLWDSTTRKIRDVRIECTSLSEQEEILKLEATKCTTKSFFRQGCTEYSGGPVSCSVMRSLHKYIQLSDFGAYFTKPSKDLVKKDCPTRLFLRS